MENLTRELTEELQRSEGRVTLSLHERGIFQLSDGIMGKLIQFKYLKELSLAGNQISILPDNFAELNNLERLDLSRNPITDISIVTKLPNLKLLHISTNQELESKLKKTVPKLSLQIKEKLQSKDYPEQIFNRALQQEKAQNNALI